MPARWNGESGGVQLRQAATVSTQLAGDTAMMPLQEYRQKDIPQLRQPVQHTEDGVQSKDELPRQHGYAALVEKASPRVRLRELRLATGGVDA